MRRFIFSLLLIGAMAAPAYASALDDVRNSMLKFEAVKTYHTTMQMSGMTIQADMVKPNRVHMTSPMFEAIMLPNAMYMKQNGKWSKLPNSGMGTGDFTAEFDKAKADMKRGDFGATDLGMQNISGVSLHAYRVTSKQTQKPITLYINAQGYPARMEFMTDKGTSAMTLSNFNAPMTINAPI